jgi:tetratricopeptide (TPR) repeat protein
MGTYSKGGVAINPAALRQARLSAELSLQEAVGDVVTRQALYQFEHGLARPKRATLEAIAKRLGVPVESLLARPHDSREEAMRELAELREWVDLERLARRVIADANVTPRMHAVASFYLGQAIVGRDPVEAIAVLGPARRHLAQLGEPWLAAEARDWEAVALYHREDPSALDVGHDALARYRTLASRNPGVEARMLEHIASYLLQRQEVAEALATYRRALEVAGPITDLARLATLHHGIASSCVRLGRNSEAIEYFERAVHLSRILADAQHSTSPNLARLENDYADLLVGVGRFERAEEMAQASLDHFVAAGVENGRAAAMLTMGDLKHCLGAMPDAMQWTSEAIDQAERQGETVLLAAGYQQLGELCLEQGERDRFEACFMRAFELIDRLDLPERLAQAIERYRRARDKQTESSRGAR